LDTFSYICILFTT